MQKQDRCMAVSGAGRWKSSRNGLASVSLHRGAWVGCWIEYVAFTAYALNIEMLKGSWLLQSVTYASCHYT